MIYYINQILGGKNHVKKETGNSKTKKAKF